MLGRPLDVPSLTAYVLAYGSPHGGRVQGWGFLTDIQYPAPMLIRTALHELLHPPFERAGELDRVFTALGQDPYFQRLVQEHNPAFGYTTTAGLIEEDCATAGHIYNTQLRKESRDPDCSGVGPGRPDRTLVRTARAALAPWLAACLSDETIRSITRSGWVT